MYTFFQYQLFEEYIKRLEQCSQIEFYKTFLDLGINQFEFSLSESFPSATQK